MEQFKAILMRKIAGVPVLAYALIAILGLAWYLKRRQDANKNTSNDALTSTNTDVFPYAQPMNYSAGDVFVNVQNPPSAGNNKVPPPSGGWHTDPIEKPGQTPKPSPGDWTKITIPPPPPPKKTSVTYVVKSGDTLWGIAGKLLGGGQNYNKIYAANQAQIEAVAKQHGYSSSGGGHWIFPGESLVIPK